MSRSLARRKGPNFDRHNYLTRVQPKTLRSDLSEVAAMASAAEKLGESLKVLNALQSKGVVAVKSSDISRTHRERTLKAGFIQEVTKGWDIVSRPEEVVCESTAWYTSYWGFFAQYLAERFGEDWSLSPEQSLKLHAGDTTIPVQLLVRAPKAGNKKTDFPYNTSTLETRATLAQGDELVIKFDDRHAYMDELEAATVREEVVPFARFLGDAMKAQVGSRGL